MGDIESMYHQVQVPDDDRDFLRFLWWPNGNVNESLKVHRMKVHLFGAISSPSCTNYALRKTASDNQDDFKPEISDGVRRNFYVDDFLGSKATEDEAQALIHDTKTICTKGGFKLTKWLSNSHTVLESVPEKDRSKEVKCFETKQDVLPSERALGVLWQAERDTLGFKIGERSVPATRRGILSLSSSIYDPFGFTAPFILIPKCLLQELCRIGAGWDDEIAGPNLRRWNKWISELHLLENLNIERCFKPADFNDMTTYELHHFADASEIGYGMVTYLRMVNEKGRIHCSFVFGKARVTPLKKVTIPRLELTAATALVRINAMLLRELDYKIDKVYWTDSTSVLRYLANEKCRFHTFVANRIQVIREASSLNQWRYVNTLHNPADNASRGLMSSSLLKTEEWFHGPAFLWKTEDKWGQVPSQMDYDLEEDPEVKKVHSAVCRTDVMDQLLERFSTWSMLKKIAAWLLVARKNLHVSAQKRNENDPHELSAEVKPDVVKKVLSVSEIKECEAALVRYVQAKHFNGEIKALQNKRNISKLSKLVKMDPFLSGGVLRAGGRLERSGIPVEAKHPIILPKDSPMSRLILEEAHKRVGHLGKNAILAKVRQTYWIIGANSLIKSMLAKCVTCKRYQATPNTQKMASLPEERVTINPPFSKVGVDYFGPFEIKRGRSLVKRWGVIFTCLTVRAVHLEVAASLDTDSCICAIRRFTARRGPVQYIRSDNGTNFIGAERELREEVSKLDASKIQSALHQHGIQWEFNPPTASNFGGVWERLIRLVRKVMYSLLHTQTIRLDDEGLSSLFCEVEGILNGRPISEMPNSPNDLDVLTPNHLLLFRGGELAPPGVFYKEDSYCRRRWRQLQYLTDLFWRRWVQEYLPLLQKKQKWNTVKKNLKEGDMVLVMDNSPRNAWCLGRVVDAIKDKRGLVRVVKLRTKSGTYCRPLNKLCLLLESN